MPTAATKTKQQKVTHDGQQNIHSEHIFTQQTACTDRVVQQALWRRQTVQNMTVIIITVITTLHYVFIWFNCCRPHTSVDENVRLSTMDIIAATQSDCWVIAVNPRLYSQHQFTPNYHHLDTRASITLSVPNCTAVWKSSANDTSAAWCLCNSSASYTLY